MKIVRGKNLSSIRYCPYSHLYEFAQSPIGERRLLPLPYKQGT